jgi:hypothetical protein
MFSRQPTSHRRVRRVGRVLTQEEIDDLAMCRCKLLPDCHLSLHCAQERATRAGE